ncbi:MAG: glutamine--fructose-6-phosphate aminotransferase, partial [Gemmatimonadota bacterium]|nr:glutamine--fructose-6-phosphate aminotransferase [Gemmatimonadota bacterium]
MCGIVGYIGTQQVTPLLIQGLKRLEYRGYDSAGVAVVRDGIIQIRKEAGKIAELERVLGEEPVEGVYGIGHTRWATHGPPTDRNAHPHTS